MSLRIFRAYFRKRLHSALVGVLSKDLAQSDRDTMSYCKRLTKLFASTFQTYGGKVLSSGSNRSCDSHNMHSTGSSKPLQQHANETTVAFTSDTISSCTSFLRISFTLRHGCMLNLKVLSAHGLESCSNLTTHVKFHSQDTIINEFTVCCSVSNMGGSKEADSGLGAYLAKSPVALSTLSRVYNKQHREGYQYGSPLYVM